MHECWHIIVTYIVPVMCEEDGDLGIEVPPIYLYDL